MKQIVQTYEDGDLRLADAPTPICRRGGVVVRSAYSVVSVGTERMKVRQARMSLMSKARARPDKVRQVLQSIGQVGVRETFGKVRERLAALTPLGYSLAGYVTEAGAGVDDLQVGDAVACAGEGYACHAEYIYVPRNLCVRVPEGVALKDAAFATVGAIAMNGLRQAGVALGDRVLVIGLGLVGQLAVQLLKAAGCRVIGVDIDPRKIERARAAGADLALERDAPALEERISDFTQGVGPDVAYVAASTQSSDPLDLAGRVLRDRGRVVIVGMAPINADWRTYYAKELSVVLSRSYGPGRYDPTFEQKGVEYPIGYVPWNQRRNLRAFLDLVRGGAVQPAKLAPRVYPFADAPQAYRDLHGNGDALAIVFEYPHAAPAQRRIANPSVASRRGASEVRPVSVGLIGAGNFATGTLIPALKRCPGVRLRAVCSAQGLRAAGAAERHGFEYGASDPAGLFDDAAIDAVVIATRHDTHAQLAAAALAAGKHVYVEKPLALSAEEVDALLAAADAAGAGRTGGAGRASAPAGAGGAGRARAPAGAGGAASNGCGRPAILMPGFNRRFSPLAQRLREVFAGRSSPIEMLYRVNAGRIAGDSWYKDGEEGGWRIVSEGCHFIDLMQFICAAPPVRVSAAMTGGEIGGAQNDNCAVTVTFADGSVGVLLYVANGDPRLEKERLEVFGQGRAAVLDNFQRLDLWPGAGRKRMRVRGHGKGHAEALGAFMRAVAAGEPAPLPLEQAVATTHACLAAERALLQGGGAARVYAYGDPGGAAGNGSGLDRSGREPIDAGEVVAGELTA